LVTQRNIFEIFNHSFFLLEFWKTVEDDYVHVFVTNQYDDHYSIRMKSAYLNSIEKLRQMMF